MARSSHPLRVPSSPTASRSLYSFLLSLPPSGLMAASLSFSLLICNLGSAEPVMYRGLCKRKCFARAQHKVNTQQMSAFTKQKEKPSQLLGTWAEVILSGLPTCCSFTGGLMKLLKHGPDHGTQPPTCAGSQWHPEQGPAFKQCLQACHSPLSPPQRLLLQLMLSSPAHLFSFPTSVHYSGRRTWWLRLCPGTPHPLSPHPLCDVLP